ncbi:MAG: glycosyltransferase [Gemmatimonadetes bacterium]|nr:glycosyltransferase [Gemmatimonadota bacterium]
MSVALGLLPWIVFGFVAVLRLKDPIRLSSGGSGTADPEVAGASASGASPAPLVSVIVPARNEALSIEECVGSLLASTYPRFEVIVVDDRSTDDTAARVRAFADPRLAVLEGEDLPPGWFGKPWACWQGAREATGDVLLFTDADTWHGPELLEHAVRELDVSGADALTLLGDQRMGSFWERVVQPQMFFLIAARYPDLRKLYRTPLQDPARWPEAIANGQYILVRRSVYDAVGGHETVRHEVVEDLRLAQELVRGGHAFLLREARGRFATRMYRSLGDLVGGWSKNVWTGSRQSVSGPLGRVLLPAGVLALLTLWVVPPLALLAALAGVGGTAFLVWAAITTGIVFLFWAVAGARFGTRWFYGFAAPLGAAVTVWILIRSAWRGSRIEWKGRTYEGSG